MHGTDTTSETRSVRSQELYNNWIDQKNTGALQEWRGGSGNAFNNRFSEANNPSGTWGGSNAAFSADGYHCANNYCSPPDPVYNSADGTGPFDINDRSTVDLFGGSALIACNGTNPDGSDATNKPCLPTAPNGAIYAGGTGATVGQIPCIEKTSSLVTCSNPGNKCPAPNQGETCITPLSGGGNVCALPCDAVILPGVTPSTVTLNKLRGYVVKDATDSKRSYCGNPPGGIRRWAVIFGHPANTNLFELRYDDADGHLR